MAKQPFISHTVGGYSRYDVPESKAFTATPGIAYPVRIQFVNARDRISIDQGLDVRSNPFAVPTFNPYSIRLHRFWVPLQLYHPEARVNASKFDMNKLSLNWIPISGVIASDMTPGVALGNSRYAPYQNSLLFWLRALNTAMRPNYSFGSTMPVSLPNDATASDWVNADTYLAYWDIIRNYYSFSQWSVYSFAYPANWGIYRSGSAAFSYTYNSGNTLIFNQRFGNLEYLDAFFESQFYPTTGAASSNSFNRINLFTQIVNSDMTSTAAGFGSVGDGFPVSAVSDINLGTPSTARPTSQTSTADSSGSRLPALSVFLINHPLAVVPSSPDRYSRLIPTGEDSAVSLSGVDTIPQLAIASRMQEYKDLLGAGGSRFSDWLDTFFASKIEHVDRPKLLFSASSLINVQVIMNQAGSGGEDQGYTINNPLGQQGGSVCFNSRMGRRQSYYFAEPGYMIDILSIRPVYFWSGVKPDYLHYQGADYFNPIYNDIGYQDVPDFRFGEYGGNSIAQEPCFNEFRASYDEALGLLSRYSGAAGSLGFNLSSYWLQQRSAAEGVATQEAVYKWLFVDMSTVNNPFSSTVEDNFFVNLSYSVQLKNLVNKTFATRLSRR